MNRTIHHLVSTGTPGSLECRTSTDCVCVICIFFPQLAQWPSLSPFYDLHGPNVSSSLGHRVWATVNLLLPHTTSIFLTRTKVYGYNAPQVFSWFSIYFIKVQSISVFLSST